MVNFPREDWREDSRAGEVLPVENRAVQRALHARSRLPAIFIATPRGLIAWVRTEHIAPGAERATIDV